MVFKPISRILDKAKAKKAEALGRTHEIEPITETAAAPSEDTIARWTDPKMAMLRDWVMRLPAAHRPWELVSAYPHVLLTIITLSDSPDELLEFLDGLLIDKRGGRAGFPPELAVQILWIDDYCRTKIRAARKQSKHPTASPLGSSVASDEGDSSR